MSAFDRLHPGLKQHLWDLRWAKLRQIQVDTIEHVLDGRGDVVLTAPTASGKTEAAFLPILSRIAEEPGAVGFRAIYIGAVKALINDQFRRMEDLCTRLEVEVHRWHGDIHQGARRKALRKPTGVLLITPESLEAMFVLRPLEMPRLFGNLRFVVIDELHAFMGTERGAQLRSQFHRLGRRCGCDPVRIGLSATIADPHAACRWLRPVGEPATHIHDADASREVAVGVRGYWVEGPKAPSEGAGAMDEVGEDSSGTSVLKEIARMTMLAVHGQTTLAFANSKAKIEMFADALQQEIDALALADEVVVHHGSISKDFREAAEERLARGRCIGVCSNTLELGIDIGAIDGVVQLAAPPSVAALAQRVGRSGRRGGAAQLRGFFVAERSTERSQVWEGLQLDFLRAVACVDLLLERFVEPLLHERTHYSTLVQQLLSCIRASGGAPTKSLYDLFSSSMCFGEIKPERFMALLRSLGSHDLIAQMPGGDLVLGMKGERIVDHYEFFAAFRSTEEVAVHDLQRGAKIGVLPVDLVPAVGEYVLLAGRRWQVVEFDRDAKSVLVKPGSGRRPPTFRSTGRDVHAVVHARMRALAVGEESVSYLDEAATEILAAIRSQARVFGRFSSPVVELGRECAVFLWAGSRVSRTVYLWLLDRGIATRDFEVGVTVVPPAGDVESLLGELAEVPPSAAVLARLADEVLGVRLLSGEKYDEFIPVDMWREAYAREQLDVDGASETARELLKAWKGSPCP